MTTSRKYEDRLETLENVRSAGISVCAGGIIGLGEGEKDRIGLIHQLATLPAHPESVPINRLVAVKGTPFEVRCVDYVAQFLRVVHDAQHLVLNELGWSDMTLQNGRRQGLMTCCDRSMPDVFLRAALSCRATKHPQAWS